MGISFRSLRARRLKAGGSPDWLPYFLSLLIFAPHAAHAQQYYDAAAGRASVRSVKRHPVRRDQTAQIGTSCTAGTFEGLARRNRGLRHIGSHAGSRRNATKR